VESGNSPKKSEFFTEWDSSFTIRQVDQTTARFNIKGEINQPLSFFPASLISLTILKILA
jgi:hypothetical protein